MAKITVNSELVRFLTQQNYTLARRTDQLLRSLDGPRRDIDVECQYPKHIDISDYKQMYDREGYGKKAVETLPNETWKVKPVITENKRKRSTPFEKAVDALCASPLSPMAYMKELDIRCGIGRFGAMVLRINDGLGFDKPAAGVKPDGTADQVSTTRNVLYGMDVYDESEIRVLEVEGDVTNPRWGLPLTYEIYDCGMQKYADGQLVGPPSRGEWRQVHWTRVIHAADNCPPGKGLGTPRQQPIFNRLLDIRKILGGDGEMFWKGGFPGLVASADPNLLEAGAEITIDAEALKEQLRLYMDGLQRYLTLVGMQVESLSPQVADPTPHVVVHLNAIACALNMPLRIFLGSEEGKLAGGHDKRNWEGRIKMRQTDFATPVLTRPLFDRFICLGVLPPTKELDEFKKPKYLVEWPDVALPNEDEQSTVADRLCAAMQKFITSGAHKGMQWSDFLRFIMRMEPEVVEEILANAKKKQEIEFPEPNAGAGDSGVAGKPPSDPKPVTVK